MQFGRQIQHQRDVSSPGPPMEFKKTLGRPGGFVACLPRRGAARLASAPGQSIVTSNDFRNVVPDPLMISLPSSTLAM
jgi:hypothetical protein